MKHFYVFMYFYCSFMDIYSVHVNRVCGESRAYTILMYVGLWNVAGMVFAPFPPLYWFVWGVMMFLTLPLMICAVGRNFRPAGSWECYWRRKYFQHDEPPAEVQTEEQVSDNPDVLDLSDKKEDKLDL